MKLNALPSLDKVAELLPFVLTLVNGVKSLWSSVFGPPKTEEEKKAAQWNKAVKQYANGKKGMTFDKLQKLRELLYPEGIPEELNRPD